MEKRTKKNNQLHPTKKQIAIGIAVAAAAIIVLTALIIVMYQDAIVRTPRPQPAPPETVVARVNGLDIPESAVRNAMPWAENHDEAVKIAAEATLRAGYARRWGLDDDSPTELARGILADPEKVAIFQPYMPEDERNAAESLAQELLERILAGEDFNMLAQMYSDDPGLERSPNGLTFTHGDLLAEIEQATLALAIGEISDIVPTLFGFHIVQRIEPDPGNVISGSRFNPESGDELIGAKHIIIEGVSLSPERRMTAAINNRFQAMVDEANIELLPALDAIR